MKRIAVLFVVLLCLITGLGCETERGVQNPVHDMPEHMPTDFNFSVRYGYGDTPKNEVNTYNHQIEKDLIQLGKATATITLTTEEMSQIYSRLYDMNVMGLRNVSFNQSWGGTRCAKIPYYTESWNITVAGKSQTLEWSDESCEVTSEAKQLSALRQFIHSIVETKAEYKALPDATGGYE